MNKKKEKESCVSCGSKIHPIDLRHHPVLNLPHCSYCHTSFLQTGDISTYRGGVDRDGSDNFCRCCGDGGDLILCNEKLCRSGFCNDCVKRILGQKRFREIIDGEEWYCFTCNYNQISKWHLERPIKLVRPERNGLKPHDNGTNLLPQSNHSSLSSLSEISEVASTPESVAASTPAAALELLEASDSTAIPETAPTPGLRAELEAATDLNTVSDPEPTVTRELAGNSTQTAVLELAAPPETVEASDPTAIPESTTALELKTRPKEVPGTFEEAQLDAEVESDLAPGTVPQPEPTSEPEIVLVPTPVEVSNPTSGPESVTGPEPVKVSESIATPEPLETSLELDEELEPSTPSQTVPHLEPAVVSEPVEALDPTVFPEPVSASDLDAAPEPASNLETVQHPEPAAGSGPVAASLGNLASEQVLAPVQVADAELEAVSESPSTHQSVAKPDNDKCSDIQKKGVKRKLPISFNIFSTSAMCAKPRDNPKKWKGLIDHSANPQGDKPPATDACSIKNLTSVEVKKGSISSETSPIDLLDRTGTVPPPVLNDRQSLSEETIPTTTDKTTNKTSKESHVDMDAIEKELDMSDNESDYHETLDHIESVESGPPSDKSDPVKSVVSDNHATVTTNSAKSVKDNMEAEMRDIVSSLKSRTRKEDTPENKFLTWAFRDADMVTERIELFIQSLQRIVSDRDMARYSANPRNLFAWVDNLKTILSMSGSIIKDCESIHKFIPHLNMGK